MGKGRRGRPNWWAASWAIAAAFSLPIGCVKPPADASSRLERVHHEAAEMDAAFDRLEERLLGSRANLAMWSEMARRHQAVSQIACQNLDEHVKDMARNLERQRNKETSLKRRLASADRLRGGFTASSKLRE